MRTTYFWKATHEPEPGVRYVSISRQKQRGAEDMEEYEPLMPSWDIINMAHEMGYSKECEEIYKQMYFKQLSQLDPKEIYEQFKNCTLVCFESSKDIASGKKFCHRRMFAGWIEQSLGILVPEETREKEKHLFVPAIYNSPTVQIRNSNDDQTRFHPHFHPNWK